MIRGYRNENRNGRSLQELDDLGGLRYISSEHHFCGEVRDKWFIHHGINETIEVSYEDYLKVIQIIAKHSPTGNGERIIMVPKSSKVVKSHITRIIKRNKIKENIVKNDVKYEYIYITSEYHFDEENNDKYFIHHKKYGVISTSYNDYFKVMGILARNAEILDVPLHNINNLLTINENASKEIEEHIKNIINLKIINI
jgi:hypothetical protein